MDTDATVKPCFQQSCDEVELSYFFDGGQAYMDTPMEGQKPDWFCGQ